MSRGPVYITIMDSLIRSLERDALAGDPAAVLALANARRRAGTWSSPIGGDNDDGWSSAFGGDGAGVSDLYDQVAVVVAARAGQNDGESWIGLFRLFDGRYVGITAWCDYTGWG